MSYFRTNWYKNANLMLLNIKYSRAKSTIPHKATTEKLLLISLVYRISSPLSIVNSRFWLLKAAHSSPHSLWNPGFPSSVCGGKYGNRMNIYLGLKRSFMYFLCGIGTNILFTWNKWKLFSMHCDKDSLLYSCGFYICRFRTCR